VCCSRPNSQAEVWSRRGMEGGYVLPRVGTVDDPLRLAVLISGGGSGLAALLTHQEVAACLHRTVLVVADGDASGLDHGRGLGIPSKTISLPNVSDKVEQRLAHEALVLAELEAAEIECVVLSGYMRILTPSFVKRWKGRLVNIHPSLLPKYPGAHAHRDALADGAKVSGCTVHLVNEGVDSGYILAAEEVPVLDGDSEEDLQERVKKVEQILYPEVLDRLAAGAFSV